MAQISTQICRMCSESNGIFYCYECQHALCTICRERHDMIPATSGHTITNTSTIDLAVFSQKSQCPKHDKEFLFLCVKCSDFICSKCVISTHKDHSFSGIAEAVSEEREHAKQQITGLKAKMEAVLSIQVKVRSYIDQLNDDSKSCIETITSTSKDLQTFIERRKNIKITEVEDNKILEQQNYESFMKNNEVIYKQYTQIISELENILPEKHDITFHSCYGVINIDIQNLANVPDKPPTAKLHSFENKVLYKEIIENLESKSDESLCRSCKIHQTRIDQLLKENIVFQKELQRCTKLMTQKDEEIHKMGWTIAFLEEKNDSDNEEEESEYVLLSFKI
ncbi:E3 ubiquitin-protein ligase TRIM71-like [Mytilus trossulus]|uniref:E3 ubiquitin-protein ligase TRIM71-like n=1 Tax=Mytilus trossulus TaxID=6551 RepID=UPI00300724D5